jgi:hypothetical protein
MDLTMWLIILGVAIWLAFMVFALALSIRPSIVQVMQWLVCPPGTSMEVETMVYSYHRPGERAIIISCVSPGTRRDIKVRTLLSFWVLCLVISLPIASIGVILIYRFIVARGI